MDKFYIFNISENQNEFIKEDIFGRGIYCYLDLEDTKEAVFHDIVKNRFINVFEFEIPQEVGRVLNSVNLKEHTYEYFSFISKVKDGYSDFDMVTTDKTLCFTSEKAMAALKFLYGKSAFEF